MKNILLAMCLLLSYDLFAQSSDERSIRLVMDAQTNAWNNGNIPAFMETYWKSDSLVFIGKNGPNYGWQNTLDGYKKRYPDTVAMGKLHFDVLQVRRLSVEYYFVIGNFHLQRSIGNLSGIFTLLFRKINGQWVIVADHTS
jgi:ketosteroid isomerase-like protein